jgi:hypothetical protein
MDRYWILNRCMVILTVAIVVLLTFVVTILVMHIIGIFLPKALTIEKSVRLNAGKEKVWQIINDIEKTPEIMGSRTNAWYLPENDEGIKRWVEHYPGKRKLKVVYKITVDNPPNHLRWAIEEQSKLGFGGYMDFKLIDYEGKTLLTLRQVNDIHFPLIRFFSLFLNHSRKINQYLYGLSKYIDSIKSKS